MKERTYTVEWERVKQPQEGIQKCSSLTAKVAFARLLEATKLSGPITVISIKPDRPYHDQGLTANASRDRMDDMYTLDDRDYEYKFESVGYHGNNIQKLFDDGWEPVPHTLPVEKHGGMRTPDIYIYLRRERERNVPF